MAKRWRPWPGHIVAHKGWFLIQTKDASGKWVQRSTGLRSTDENRAAAEAKLSEAQIAMRALADATDGAGGPMTVSRWAETWIVQRRDRVRDHENDESRMRTHILPAIGGMLLAEVRPRHLVDLFLELKQKGRAPRTRWNIYGVAQAMFRDARMADLITGEQNPCILTHYELGRVRDAKKGWRSGAVFDRAELGALISDPRIPEDRRVTYALLGIGMLRDGEACGLRWLQLETAEPLHRMVVNRSYDGEVKTDEERWMPVHPKLASILAAWKLSGWAREFGRLPEAGDLVIPVTAEKRKGRRRPLGSMRTRHHIWKRLRKDLVLLGFRHRRAHDFRRTGISLAQDDGADKDILRWGTHAPPREVFDLYTSLQWATLCREVAKLNLRRGQEKEGRGPQ